MINITFKLIQWCLFRNRWWYVKEPSYVFYCIILNIYVMESAAYVLQMFYFIWLHFDILLSIVMKATEWKTLLEDICQRNEIHMESGFNQHQTLVCLYTERDWIKSPSDWLLIDSSQVMCSKKEFVWMCACVCVSVCVYMHAFVWKCYHCWDKVFKLAQ